MLTIKIIILVAIIAANVYAVRLINQAEREAKENARKMDGLREKIKSDANRVKEKMPGYYEYLKAQGEWPFSD